MSRKTINRKCAVETCDSTVGPKGAKDFCAIHYDRFTRYGDPNHPLTNIRRSGTICSILDCGRPRRGLDWCHMHYRRWRLYGTTGSSSTNYGKGSFTPFGYKLIYRNGKQRFEHRVIMEALLGRPLKRSEEVHHIDGCPWNNDPGNLRILTNGEHRKIHTKPHWDSTGKDCPSCNKFLPLTEFFTLKGKPTSYCRECHKTKLRISGITTGRCTLYCTQCGQLTKGAGKRCRSCAAKHRVQSPRS